MNILSTEVQRQARGICAIAAVLGWPLTNAVLVMACTLVALAFAFRGPWIAIAGGICLLLAIRAHDIGDVDEAEPTELDSDHSPLARAREEEAARIAAATFLRDRHATALGRPHDGQEL